MYVLDTNTVIYYQKRDERVVPILREILVDPAIAVYVSTLTEVELFSFPKLSEEESEIIDGILQAVSLIPLNSQIARIAGHVRATYNLKLADSVIAATTLFTGSTLLTRNTKDFQKIPQFNLRPI